MHASATLLPVLMGSIAMAAPHSLQRRDVTINYTGGAVCQGTGAIFADSWGVYFPGNVMGVETDRNGLGGGLLDNLRGRCGDITGWSPSRDAAGTGLGVTFATSVFCTQYDITQAINAASGGTTVGCTWNNNSEVVLEAEGKLIYAIGDAVKELFKTIALILESVD